jgi:glycosyltransferase involved in cell wall biosynthesis
LFGIVNIEAMASGMIVIASNHVGPKEIIENGKNGFLVEEKDVEQFKNILNQLYNNPNIMNKISKNAVEYAKNFDIKNISQKWKEAINA